MAVVAFAVVAPAGEARGHAPCRPKESRTLRHTKQVRVFELKGRYGGTTVYGCAYSIGRRYRMGDNYVDEPYDGARVAPIRIRGRSIAYVQQWHDHYGSVGAAVFVRDLRDGTLLHSFDRGGGGNSGGCASPPPYSVTDLVLAPTGSVAWIGTKAYCDHHLNEVDAIAGAGELQTLDDAPRVQPTSLAYSNGRISWLNDGKRRSAPLP